MVDIVHSRKLLGQKINGDLLLDYVLWREADQVRFKAFFARGTNRATYDKMARSSRMKIRTIGGGLALYGTCSAETYAESWLAEVTPSKVETALFAGLNTILAFRNEEPMETVRAWLEFHVRNHGANAALIVDRAPGPSGLTDALRDPSFAIAGLKCVLVLSSPVSLGRTDLPPEKHPYCAPAAPGKNTDQPASDPWTSPLGEFTIFEAVRARFLEEAAAVAFIDVHDLMLPVDGANIFERAQASPSGVVSLEGHLAYPWRIRSNEPSEFGDHIFVQFNENHIKRRWCVAPKHARASSVWRLVYIAGTGADSFPVFRYISCMGIRHSGASISQIVPKSSLVENSALLKLSVDLLNGKPIRSPAVEYSENSDAPDRSVVAVTCMKNEGPFILEWIAYHRMIGIRNFLVYTNDCDDGTDTLLDLLQEKGYVQHRKNPFHGTDLKPQHAALNAAESEEIVKDSAWCISMDVDEFICVHVGDGTLNALFDEVLDANMISLTWRLFGNSGIDTFEDQLITEKFTRCARKFAPRPHQAWGFKTLFRQNGIFRKMGVHRPKGLQAQLLNRLKWVNGSGEDMPVKTIQGA